MSNQSEDQDIPPLEEIEMGTEELLGHALPGVAAKRVEAMKKRIAYLQEQIRCARDADSLALYKRDLAEARQQLAEWQRKEEGLN